MGKVPLKSPLSPGTESCQEGFGLGRRLDAEPGFQDRAASVVDRKDLGRSTKLVMAGHKVLIELLGEIVHLKGLLVAFYGSLRL